MKQNLSFVTLIIVLFCSAPISSQTLDKKHLENISNTIVSEEVFNYALEMSDPKYKGRLAGSPEYMDIAQWAADFFHSWGIDPAGNDGSYFQLFRQPYSEVNSTGEFSLTIGEEVIHYNAPEDYYPGAKAANGKVEGELFFVGYGITAPELGYNDFYGVDVEGKIVVIAPGNPYKGEDPVLRTQWGAFSSGNYKLQNALQHGAAGVIYMDKLANPGAPYGDSFIYVHAGEKPVADIFKPSGINHTELLESIDESMTPNSFSLGIEALLAAETVYHPDGFTANVVGVIPGNDSLLKDEVIILGAHLDGQGQPGIHFPGALDNASGVANVMAAARALSQLKGTLKRTVVFILFAAEETGLHGSEFYCLNPISPAEKTVVFVNLDMVGNGSGLAVWGSESFPELQHHFVWANENIIKGSLRTSPFRYPSGRPRTDGAMFSIHGFRTLHLSTTERVNPLYYHDPRDTPEFLVADIMRDAARLLFVASARMANDTNLNTVDLPAVSEFSF